ncbi:hypothetical protein C2869_00895 [Saccharobesus litoralis]|uniref:Uncharacterized protein n=2 Tax=Saccharobesus litoralis TaxID=2172099 RepID=A0A2S0VLJ5_9ALTE|nr:hypothetical protein C2869_00895 [Saccharobesus litoralis]
MFIICSAIVITIFYLLEDFNFKDKRSLVTQNNQSNQFYNEDSENSSKKAIDETIKYTPKKLNVSGKDLRRCAKAAKNEIELDKKLHKAAVNDEPQAFINELISDYDYCIDIDIDARKLNYIEVLIREARYGSREAFLEFWKISEKEYFNISNLKALTTEETLNQRQKFISLKYQLAHKFAIIGNNEALLKLVSAYLNYDPVSQSPNLVKSLAYADLGLQTTDDNETYLKLDWYKQRILNSASIDNVGSAQTITEQLLEESTKAVTN